MGIYRRGSHAIFELGEAGAFEFVQHHGFRKNFAGGVAQAFFFREQYQLPAAFLLKLAQKFQALTFARFIEGQKRFVQNQYRRIVRVARVARQRDARGEDK